MLEQILRILKDQYDISGVNGNTNISKEIELDSFAITSFIFDIEEYANVEIDTEEFAGLETINDLVELISQKQAEQ